MAGEKAANHIYRKPDRRPDHRFSTGGFISAAVLNEPGVDYELDKFSFFGTPESEDHYVFLTEGILIWYIGSSPRRFRNKNRRAIGGPFHL